MVAIAKLLVHLNADLTIDNYFWIFEWLEAIAKSPAHLKVMLTIENYLKILWATGSDSKITSAFEGNGNNWKLFLEFEWLEAIAKSLVHLTAIVTIENYFWIFEWLVQTAKSLAHLKVMITIENYLKILWGGGSNSKIASALKYRCNSW